MDPFTVSESFSKGYSFRQSLWQSKLLFSGTQKDQYNPRYKIYLRKNKVRCTEALLSCSVARLSAELFWSNSTMTPEQRTKATLGLAPLLCSKQGHTKYCVYNFTTLVSHEVEFD